MGMSEGILDGINKKIVYLQVNIFLKINIRSIMYFMVITQSNNISAYLLIEVICGSSSHILDNMFKNDKFSLK